MTLLPPSVPILLLGEALGTKEDRRQSMSVWELPRLAAWAYLSRISKRPWDRVFPPKVRDFLQSLGTAFCYFLWVLMGRLALHGPSLQWAGSLQREQTKGERWSHGYGLKSSCWHSLDVAVTRQERADIGLSQRQHLLWDMPVFFFIRKKQGKWILSDFIIYMSVFQAVFATCKVSQTWASWAMFSRKAYDYVKHYSGITYCAVHPWQLPQHFFFLSDLSKKNSCAAYGPLCQGSSCWCYPPLPSDCFAKSASSRSSEIVTLKRMVLALTRAWAVRSRAEHRNLGDPWFCIFSNTWM